MDGIIEANEFLTTTRVKSYDPSVFLLRVNGSKVTSNLDAVVLTLLPTGISPHHKMSMIVQALPVQESSIHNHECSCGDILSA
jgi:hypothetical protein